MTEIEMLREQAETYQRLADAAFGESAQAELQRKAQDYRDRADDLERVIDASRDRPRAPTPP